MAKKALDQKKIDQITPRLSEFLADTFLLYVKTLNFHWNMTGPQFFMYHKLLEEQYQHLANAVDDIAERIRQLGERTPATLGEFLKLSNFKEPGRDLSQKQMVEDLIESHNLMEEQCHHLIDFTENLLDQGTADMVIEQIRFHAKQSWLLRSHL
jgi:starvation-inducible DNA-binding protein